MASARPCLLHRCREHRQLIGPGEISEGQNVWQSIGGMEVGSIWGHGSYVAPDWTADWLHREATFILDAWSGSPAGYAALNPARQAELQSRLLKRGANK